MVKPDRIVSAAVVNSVFIYVSSDRNNIYAEETTATLILNQQQYLSGDSHILYRNKSKNIKVNFATCWEKHSLTFIVQIGLEIRNENH